MLKTILQTCFLCLIMVLGIVPVSSANLIGSWKVESVQIEQGDYSDVYLYYTLTNPTNYTMLYTTKNEIIDHGTINYANGFSWDSDASLHGRINPGDEVSLIYGRYSVFTANQSLGTFTQNYAQIELSLSYLHDSAPNDWDGLSWRTIIDFTPFTIEVVDSTNQGGNTVPEPTAMILFGFGLLGITGVSRRKK